MFIFIPNFLLKHVTKPNFIANFVLKTMYKTQMKSLALLGGAEGELLQRFSQGECFLVLSM